MTLPLLDLAPLVNPDSRPPDELAATLGPASHPLTLLPVRLETRFVAPADELVELRVRVYPDKIHLDAHDPQLSAAEADLGRQFWQAWWRAADDDARQRSAWRMLTDRFGPGRAGWIAEALTPLNADQANPQAQPRFPDLGPPAERTATPVARGLPARWVATAYQDGHVAAVVTGADIPTDLHVGPDLNADPVPGQDQPAMDTEMAWMVDFEEAERCGMGLRLPVPGPLAEARVDLLLVTGLASGDADEGASVLARLLASQQYTDGLAVLAPGTPTNNSADGRSGHRSRDVGGAESFAARWRSVPVTPTSDVGRAARALGLDPAENDLGRLTGAGRSSDQLAEAVQTALWPVTWGYFLSQFIGIGTAGLDLSALEWARSHARRFLRPGGALPVLRVGRQPYGLLPVTTLTGHVGTGPDARRQDRLQQLVTALRDQVWRPALIRVPRVGASRDPSGDLVDVLRSDAVATGYRVRRSVGPQYLRHLRLLLGEDLDALGFWARLRAMTDVLPSRLGFDFSPGTGGQVHEGQTDPVTVPLISRPAANGSGTSHGEQIAALLAATDLTDLSDPPPESGSVLQTLLRHGLLREHALAAARLLENADRPLAALLRDAELVDLGPGPAATFSWRWQRAQTLPGRSHTVGEHLQTLTDFSTPEVASLGEFRSACSVLAETSSEDLELALRLGLETTSTRLDAWISSLATRRLAELREGSPRGTVIGGYGWLENLRPEPQVPVTALPPGEPGPLVSPPDDPGFLHAPSLDQASAAALLRNAHIAQQASEDGPYAVSLTSERVRKAARLFDGVRQGQSLGALLGYDVERRLHELGLDEFVDDFRTIAPPPDTSPEDAVRRRTITDGLELHRQFVGNADHLPDHLNDLNGIPFDDPRRPQVVGVFRELEAAIDAAADAVTAESVYQFARGNLVRSTGSLAEIARGQSPPPSLEFLRTPRSGTTIAHRVAVVLDAGLGPEAGSGWAGAEHSPRSEAEPVLDTWCGQLLGPATDISLVVHVGPPGAATTHRVPLTELHLAALDLVALGGDPGGVAALARHAATVAVGAHVVATLPVRLDLTPEQDRTRRGIADLLELAARIRALLSEARPVSAADLQPGHADPAGSTDLAGYEQRGDRAVERLTGLREELTATLTLDPPASVGRLRAALALAQRFGVPGADNAVPGADDDPVVPGSAARVLAGGVSAELDRRLDEAQREAPPPDGEEPDPSRLERIARRFRAVFGPAVVACPRVRAPDPAGLAASLADAQLLAEDPLAPHTWLQQMARVRPALDRLSLVLQEAELLGRPTPAGLRVAQLPHRSGQRWLGLGPTLGAAGQDGQVGLVLVGAGFDPSRRLVGLLVDDWQEVVPSPSETTGIAFRYDPPDAMAPQAVLLAVPAAVDEPWTVGGLNQVLLETLDLAHLRAVGWEQLGAVAHHLPAAVLAFNVDADVVATDPRVLAG